MAVIQGSSNDDVLNGTAEADTIRGYLGADTLNGAGGDDTLEGGDGNDTLDGDEGNDVLRGQAGDDILNGDAGDDFLVGGEGNDVIDGGEGSDRVSLFDGSGEFGIAVDLRLDGVAQNFGLLGTDTLFSIEHVTATYGNDTIHGNQSDNWMWTFAGLDTLYGYGGDDYFTVGFGDKVIDGGVGSDTVEIDDTDAYFPQYGPEGITVSLELQGQVQATAVGNWTLTGIENLSGSWGADEFTGDANANTLAGAGGDDTLVGGGGDDVLMGDGAMVYGYDADNPGAYAFFANLGDLGFDIAEGDDILSGGDGNDTIYGGGGNDVLRGQAGDDILNGDAGDDFLVGGEGNDVIDGGEGSDRVSLFDGSGEFGIAVDLRLDGVAQNFGLLGTDTLFSIEHVTATYGNDTIHGNQSDNWMWTFAGLDTLYGYGGDDYFTVGFGDKVIDGGVGSDTVEIDDTDAYFPQYGPEGITVSLELQGQVQATAVGNWTLTGIENLSGSWGADEFTGDANANTLAGAGGDDTLVGGGGDDVLMGDGAMVYGYDADNPGAYAFFANLGDLGFDIAEGDDILFGGDGNDTLYGGEDDDILDGGAGNDDLIGGLGDDTASYASASAGVSVRLWDAQWQNTGGAGSDRLTGIENLTGSAYADLLIGNAGDNLIEGGAGADTLRGGEGSDVLRGQAGDDVIDGNAGDDTMEGGLGNDIYLVRDAGDVVVEEVGSGDDTARALVDYTLDANVERLVLTKGGLTGTGNAQGNTIEGSTGTDTIFGMDGDDALYGYGSADALHGGLGADSLYGGVNDDVLNGDAGDDILRGQEGYDTLAGGDGNDRLIGGIGRDDMTGGLGADRFVFFQGDTGNARWNADRIIDFKSSEGDLIDLFQLDANSTLGGNQAFTFIGSGAFSATAGELRYVHTGGYTYVEGDTNGDGVADIFIRLDGIQDLSTADFVL